MLSNLDVNVSDTTLHALFIRQARHNPTQVALVDGEATYTYRQLDEQSNRLANYLRQYDIRPNNPIGILMEKCHEYIVAYLAILKAGGALLHLELAYPANFLQQVFSDAAPKAIITKRRYFQRVQDSGLPAVCIDTDEWHSAETTPPPTHITSDNLAVIGYSSGSTGTPKGVSVSHRACIYAYQQFWQELEAIKYKDRFAYSTFLLWDALSPLVTGHTGYIVPDHVSFDPARLVNFFAQHQINHTFLTPSLLTAIIQNVEAATLKEQLASLHVVWVGGEVTTQPLVNETLRLLPHLTLINNYGPTECFVITQGKLRANDSATPTICSVGTVLEGMDVLLLDDNRQPVAAGDVGELYASGPCLADGYLNNPALTQQKFVDINGQLYYQTGDSAQFLEDGRLIVLGRRDSTVKIRSYNVNLLAIEEALRQHPQIDDSIVVAYGDEGDDKFLVAYLIRKAAGGANSAETPHPTHPSWHINPNTHNAPHIIDYLQEHLPFYMVPHRYVELDRLPIHTISGKLDKSQLPQPFLQTDKSTSQLQPLSATATIAEQEQLLIAVLHDMLSLHVAPTDDLFALGLHSLRAAQLATRIRHLFGQTLSVATIYQHSSVRQLVAFMHDGVAQTAQIDWQREALLDETIVPSRRSVVFSAENQSIFLTGATGYLGVFLLADLLRLSPTLTVYCLVRSADRLPKLIEKLKFYQRWQPNFAKRIVPLVGDLEKPHFGWSQAVFEHHAANMQAVFHVGAWVNMVYPYGKLKAANVGGTQEAIRFAACGITKPFHYISTLGIFPAGNVSQYAEDNQIDPLIESLKIGYAQSKWVAEKLVWQAIARNLPAQIYRIGNIGPDSDTFLANDKDTVMLFLDACKKLRLAPDRVDWRFEYTPINFVAHAIAQTALCHSTPSHVYHISGQNLIAGNSVFARMQQRNLIDNIVPMSTWLRQLRQLAQTNEQYALLEQSLQIEEEYLLDEEIFDTTQFTKHVKRSQLRLPAIDEEYLIQSTFPQNFAMVMPS